MANRKNRAIAAIEPDRVQAASTTFRGPLDLKAKRFKAFKREVRTKNRTSIAAGKTISVAAKTNSVGAKDRAVRGKLAMKAIGYSRNPTTSIGFYGV